MHRVLGDLDVAVRDDDRAKRFADAHNEVLKDHAGTFEKLATLETDDERVEGIMRRAEQYLKQPAPISMAASHIVTLVAELRKARKERDAARVKLAQWQDLAADGTVVLRETK